MKISAEDRFWAKVDKSCGPESCWPWTAFRNKAGYGLFSVGGKLVRAHRFAFELANGPIPEGLHGLHHCDNPPCCNPAHLFLGSQADNMADKGRKGRQAVGDRNGQTKLTKAKVVEIRALYAAGGVSQRKLAARYVVSQRTICDIARGKTWKTEKGCVI